MYFSVIEIPQLRIPGLGLQPSFKVGLFGCVGVYLLNYFFIFFLLWHSTRYSVGKSIFQMFRFLFCPIGSVLCFKESFQIDEVSYIDW